MIEHLWRFGAVVAVAVLVAGCDGNIFSNFDNPPPPPGQSEMEDQAADDLDQFIRDIEDWIATDSFDSGDYDSAAGALRAVATDPATPVAKRQEALITAGQVEILSNDDATDLVQNLTGVLSTLTDDVEDQPEDIIAALVPSFPDTDDGRAAFDEMVATLQTAAGDFSAFAQSLSDNPGVEPDVNSGEQGDAVQIAMLSLLVDTAASTLTLDEDNDGFPDGNGTDALWHIVQGGDPAQTNIATDDPLDDLETAGTHLYTVLEYAGIADLFEEGTT